MKNIRLKNHTNFILSPVSAVLKDVISASSGIERGIETYPLYDYVMQSVFLKMTGFQEQKMKCICWELATDDYTYRYFRFTQNRLGECSTYKEKKDVYKDLIKQIKKCTPEFDVTASIDKNELLSNTTSEIEIMFQNTNLQIWAQKEYIEFKTIWKDVDKRHFFSDDNNLFNQVTNSPISLKDIYENNLYKHRNRVAHNTQSYQQNLPTLKTLIEENYKYENYFVYFAILMLMDSIFIELYKKYLEVVDDF